MNNQQKLDRIATGRNVLHSQIPAAKGDPAFPKGWSLSAEYCIAHGYINSTKILAELKGTQSTLKNISTALVRVGEGEKFDIDKMLAGIQASNEKQFEDFGESVLAEAVARFSQALEEANIPQQVAEGIITSVASFETTTKVEIKEQP